MTGQHILVLVALSMSQWSALYGDAVYHKIQFLCFKYFRKSWRSQALQFFVYEVNRCKIKSSCKSWILWTFELFWAAYLMKSLFNLKCAVKSEFIILRKLKASLSSLWTSKTLKAKHFYETVFMRSISFLSSHNSIIINWSLGPRPRCYN